MGGAITILAGLVTLMWRAIRTAVQLAGRVDEFMDDWAGEPDRPGVSGRPGVMERVAGIEDRLTRVEHELYPNSGVVPSCAVEPIWRYPTVTDFARPDSPVSVGHRPGREAR